MNLTQYVNYIFLKPVIKKKLFGKEYVPFMDYVLRTSIIYERFALLGFTYKNNIHKIVQLISTTDDTNKPLAALETLAEKRFLKLDNSTENFFQLILNTEVPDLLRKLFSDMGLRNYGVEGLLKVSKQKVPMDFVNFTMQMYNYEALGFGYKYSDLTKSYLTNEVDDQDWLFAHQAGLDIPSAPEKRKSLSMQQEDIKLLITPFIKEFKPNLLNDLGLQ